MKSNNKKVLFVLSIVMALVIISGCANTKQAAMAPRSYASSEMPYEAGPMMAKQEEVMDMAVEAYEGEEIDADGASETTGGGYEGKDTGEMERKLIVTTSFNIETKEFDKAVEQINTMIEKYGAYVENSYTQGTSLINEYQTRYASYTVRVPQSSSNDFLKEIEENYYVTATNQQTTDATENYYNLDARLNSLLDHEKRLLELMDNQSDLEHLLEVEKELAATREQINIVYNQLKSIDSLVSYNTVILTLEEVIEYEEIERPEDTFGEKLQREMRLSWNRFKTGAENAIIFLISRWYLIILLAIVVLVICFIIRKSKKNKGNKKINPPANGLPKYPPQHTQEEITVDNQQENDKK